jgi:hypothetical protein
MSRKSDIFAVYVAMSNGRSASCLRVLRKCLTSPGLRVVVLYASVAWLACAGTTFWRSGFSGRWLGSVWASAPRPHQSGLEGAAPAGDHRRSLMNSSPD